MMIKWWWCSYGLFFSLVYSFNLEPRVAIVKQNSHNGSYFGFDVSQHIIVMDNETQDGRFVPWILVGAPKETNSSGAIWKCPFTVRRNDCSRIKIGGNRFEYRFKQSGQWLGAVVKSQGIGKQVVVCAPRYVKNEVNNIWGLGKCITLTQKLKHSATWEPCKGRPTNMAHEQWGYCQAGITALITENNMVMIGAPGSYTWRGTVFAASVDDDYLFRDKTHYHTPVKPFSTPVKKYSYLGMSVAAGNFLPVIQSCGNAISYASGAPRAGNSGQVLLFVRCRSEIMNFQRTLIGEFFKSSFGYSLASADVTGDGLDELFVGAPFYNHRGFGGAVYVYYNGPNGLALDTSRIRLLSKGSFESMFGYAIANAGDINNDKYADIAIGAPYDGRGKVFLYFGSENGILVKPSQIILAEEVSFPSLRSFGYSISGGMDMDGNNHSDLVVGAYESDAVIILRSRPVIDITTWFGKRPNLIDPTLYGCETDLYAEEVCFSIESCFMIRGFPTNIEQTYLRYVLSAEVFPGGRKISRIHFGASARNFSHENSKNILVEKSRLTGCFLETAYLRKDTRDIRTSIKFQLKLQLDQDAPKPYQNKMININQYPILNQKEAIKVLEIPFQKFCGIDEECNSQLSASVLVDGIDKKNNILEIHENKEILIKVVVVNQGEPAYTAKLTLSIDASFSYVGRSDEHNHDINCDFNAEQMNVICDLGNPYEKQQTIIGFRVKPLTYSHHIVPKAYFNVTTNTSSEDINPFYSKSLEVNIIRRAEVSIRSSVYPNQIRYGGKATGESSMRVISDIGSKIVHTFQITNEGPWHVEEASVIISYPYQQTPNSNQNLGKWLLYLSELPEISPFNAGKCYLQPKYVNPLGLRDKIDGRTHFKSLERSKKSISFQVPNNSMDDATILDCASGTAQCHMISCHLVGLKANKSIVIRVRSRIWNSTLVQDHMFSTKVVISTLAEIDLPPQLKVHQSDHNDITVVHLFAYPSFNLDAGIGSIPTWIMLVSILVGVLTVSLITYLLWKLGFFKRNNLYSDDANDLHSSQELITAKFVTTKSGKYSAVDTHEYIS